MKKHRSKINIPLCLAAVLFCLTLFSVHLMGGLFAKYSVSASASDSARVITFGDVTITETGDFKEPDRTVAILPGVDLTKDVKVSFEGSEAATFVFVEVTGTGWTKNGNYGYTAANGKITWSVDSEKWQLVDGETDVYYRVLEPNKSLDKVPVIASDGTITVSKEITRTAYKSIGTLTLTFQAAVVQAGGFASVADAWNSVSN